MKISEEKLSLTIKFGRFSAVSESDKFGRFSAVSESDKLFEEYYIPRFLNERGPAKWTIQNECGPTEWTIQNELLFKVAIFFEKTHLHQKK